ncbi:MAG TPA: type II secretion system minor pseudopilin GspK [Usitatibacter sp.]|nr:type II secretion system minor pseudopilin GspK [Usitatibacter sp.]
MTRQRGVAAVTALLIVAVAAGAATLMLAQQSALLDQTLLVSGRAQADLYAQAGLDWARGVLQQDGQVSTVDSLDEGWARPIGGMPIERAVVAGDITDEQGKFNLNNLVDRQRRSEPDYKLLRQLLVLVELSPDLADAVVDWIDGDDNLESGAGAENAYYLSLPRPYRAANEPMLTVDELYRVRGFDARAVAKLRPYVTALPERTAINVNTAPDRVIAAAFGVPSEAGAQLLAPRASKPFPDKTAFFARASQAGLIAVNEFDVKSKWFFVRVAVAQDEVRVATESLVKRDPEARGTTAIVWRRPRY